MKDPVSGVVFENGYALFWGGIFSNWAKAMIHKDGNDFYTSEHMFMYGKAVIFDDPESAEKILKVKSPRDAKALGRAVKNFDPKIWDSYKYKIMREAVFEKFKWNLNLKNELVDHKYDGLHFVEASPLDRIWGIGFGVEDAFKDGNVGKWGQNLLGKALDEVRAEFVS